MKLKLIAIGALGKMLSPSANHLKGSESAQYIRVLDRKKDDDYHDACRKSWNDHGAKLVHTYEELIGDGDFDGIVVCAGKNGDDFAIFKDLLSRLNNKKNYFILHLSTVSTNFVKETYQDCKSHNVSYANYPLTGGVVGAENAKMLILASGDKLLFDKLQPMLSKIGEPRYFGDRVEQAAEVKLIGHLMVFNNLMGISSAVSLQARTEEKAQPKEKQIEFFDFLNKGAGGSRQWEVTARPAISNDDYAKGFLLQHAVVDILYAARLMLDKKMPIFSVFSLLQLALSFSHTLNEEKQMLATQSLVTYMQAQKGEKLDEFIKTKLVFPDVEKTISNCVDSLPDQIRRSVMLDVNYASSALSIATDSKSDAKQTNSNKVFVIVDAYNTGRIFPDLIKEKYKDSKYQRAVHVQSKPEVIKQMALYEKDKYVEAIVHDGDMKKTVAALKKHDIICVMPGMEPGVEFADQLSHELKLSTSNNIDKSLARRDKFEMRNAIAKAGLRAPKFIKSSNLEQILEWIRTNTTYPVVLKALKSAGTDGVFICKNEGEVKSAFANIFNKKNIMEEVNTEVLVETFLEGKEYVVDAVSHNGKHYVTDVWQYEKRFIPGHGFIYDKEFLLASDDPIVKQLVEYNSKVLDALEIKYGPSHAEHMMTKDGPVLVEVGARINGVLHTKMHNEALGHNQANLTIDCYADSANFLKTVSAFPYQRRKNAMVVNLINEQSGIIAAIDPGILQQMRNLPGVVEVIERVKPGQTLVPTRTLAQAPLRFFLAHESKTVLDETYAAIQQLKEKLFVLKPTAANDAKSNGVNGLHFKPMFQNVVANGSAPAATPAATVLVLSPPENRMG